MKRPRWVLVAVLFVAARGLLATALLLANARGFSARERPTALETWIARVLRAAALPSDVRARTNPVPNTPDVLTESRAHWADHCAICHANDGSGDAPIGKHTYPPAPDMRQAATQRSVGGRVTSGVSEKVAGRASRADLGSRSAEGTWSLKGLPAMLNPNRYFPLVGSLCRRAHFGKLS
jgi:cytochrome c553